MPGTTRATELQNYFSRKFDYKRTETKQYVLCVAESGGGCKDTGDLSATEREQKHGYRREER